jgi:ComF family protein
MNIISLFIRRLKDFLFPPYCFDCGGKVPEGQELCELCLSFLDESPLPESDSFDTGALRKIFSCYSFEEPIIRKAIHAIKYEGFPGPACSLFEYRLSQFDFSHYRYVVAVPLHRRRERWRGYNQASLLARKISADFRPELITAVRRSKYTRTQTKRKRWQRKEAMSSVFTPVKRAKELRGKSILLIDDVATTGATARECAVVLKDLGALHVDLLTLARA